MKNIIIANNKGGVGKTTIASQIVYALANKGHSVIGVDLDSQRNFTGSFEDVTDLGSALDLVTKGNPVVGELNAGDIGIVSGHKNLQAQNSDDVLLNVRNGLSKSTGADFCVIDAPPSFSEVVYGALLASDYLLVPIELKRFSLDGIEGVLEAFIAAQEHNPNLALLGLLPSRFDAVKQGERDALVALAESFERLIVPHAIRNRTLMCRPRMPGLPYPTSRHAAAEKRRQSSARSLSGFMKKLQERHAMARSLTDTLEKLAASGKLDKFSGGKQLDEDGAYQIDLASIEADPDQPRRMLDEGKLHSLSESIAAQGVLQPITVQPKNADDKHLIIMGERRWRAAQLAGLTPIPAIVREATAELRAIQLTENVQRADLTTMGIAQAVDQMREDGKKRPEIAKALGWSESAVSRYAGIAKMPDELQALARLSVPILALSDLSSLWKKDERAVRAFLAATPTENISRVTVAGLRVEIDAGQGAHSTDESDQRDQPVSRAAKPSRFLSEIAPDPEPEAIFSLTGPVAILCRYRADIGRILTDRKATSNTALMVSFADGNRIEEIALSEIELLEVIDA
ncbi:Chromosome-partitioning protein ParB [Roseovarius albus]|uniref:Chromosome-partitioning protein ParB n=1 Tax=Roseovarius albus TaxID=1247867 RepID=A0A1X7A3X3_9RHOB|nr:ParB/RepB/Spo0J family partition protein [Roseovarius albus]SLN69943.1 Chromosome-partitioning protein ParB [Roseovarius albus]